MKIIGRITAINTSDGKHNLAVLTKDNETFNIKIKIEDSEDIKIGGVYQFECKVKEGERTGYYVYSHTSIENLELEEKNETLRSFYSSSPISLIDAENEINNYLNKLDNKIIKDITSYLINKFHDDFYVYSFPPPK